jgi:hypothetical protein
MMGMSRTSFQTFQCFIQAGSMSLNLLERPLRLRLVILLMVRQMTSSALKSGQLLDHSGKIFAFRIQCPRFEDKLYSTLQLFR